MPPAISSDEEDDGVEVPIRSADGRNKKAVNYSKPRRDNSSDEDDEAAEETKPKRPARATAAKEEDGDEDDKEDDDEEGQAEDEFIVEKIISHMTNDAGEPLFEVKWEGYSKPEDRTWEPEDNLLENASEVLEEYYEKIGGREKVFESTKKALQTKKRGRQSTGAASGAKRAKVNGNHPLDSEPPASARAAAWKPPAGSWDDHIEMLDAMEDEAKETLVVYLTWKNGQKTQHPLPVIYKRAPQKMLQFYERHVRIIKKDPASTQE